MAKRHLTYEQLSTTEGCYKPSGTLGSHYCIVKRISDTAVKVSQSKDRDEKSFILSKDEVVVYNCGVLLYKYNAKKNAIKDKHGNYIKYKTRLESNTLSCYWDIYCYSNNSSPFSSGTEYVIKTISGEKPLIVEEGDIYSSDNDRGGGNTSKNYKIQVPEDWYLIVEITKSWSGVNQRERNDFFINPIYRKKGEEAMSQWLN